MRDNRNMEELTDRAWAGMKELLEREMPVAPQRKRRPLIWWWRSAAAAVVLLAAGFLFLRQAPENTTTDLAESPEMGAEIEIAEKGTPAMLRAAETEEKREETTAASTRINEPVKEGAPQRKRAAAAAGHAPVAVRPGLEDQPGVAANAKMESAVDPDQQEAAAGAAIGDMPAEITSVQALEENETGPFQRPEPEFDLEAIDLAELPQLAFHPLEIPALPFDKAQAYHPKKPRFTPLEVQAGLISREPVNVNGFFAGVRSGLRLGTSGKWSVQSGIGLQAQQHPFTVGYSDRLDALESQVDPGIDPTGQNGGSSGLSSDVPDQIEQSGIELQALYVDVPLLLHWQFSRKWALEAGPRLSWRLASRWRDSNTDSAPAFSGGGNLDTSSKGGGYSRQLSFISVGSSNQQPVYLVLQDFYAAGSGGVSYLLRPGWRLRLQYQHSFTNLLDSDLYRSTDRSLRLSLGIRF